MQLNNLKKIRYSNSSEGDTFSFHIHQWSDGNTASERLVGGPESQTLLFTNAEAGLLSLDPSGSEQFHSKVDIVPSSPCKPAVSLLNIGGSTIQIRYGRGY